MAVWRRSSSALATASGSAASTKINSLSGLPSSGVITRSASAKVSATMGSAARSGLEHIHVLRALAGIEERHLGRGTVTAEDALGAQSFPDARLVGRQRLERLGRFVRQVGGVGIVDGQAFGRAQIRFRRRGRSRGAARLRRLSGPRADARPARPRRRRRSPARRATALYRKMQP